MALPIPPPRPGPTTLAERQSGLGTSWLLPLVDGAPPIGWDEAGAYLALPIALVLVQYASAALTSPPIDPKVRPPAVNSPVVGASTKHMLAAMRRCPLQCDGLLLTRRMCVFRPPLARRPQDENAGTQRALMVALPLLLGWFSLNVPSGLSLYYLSNTVLSAAQQVYLKKLGGARVVLNELGPVTKPGSGRRAGARRGGRGRFLRQLGRKCWWSPGAVEGAETPWASRRPAI